MMLRIAVTVASVLAAASLTVSGLALKARFQQGDRTRAALTAKGQRSNAALRTLLCYFEELSGRRSAAVFERALVLIHAAPCAAH